MAKFKIGFVMSAETLFGIITKFIPVDDLHIEEVIEHTVPLPEPAIRFDRRFDLPKPVKQKRKRKSAIPVSLDKGINGILMKKLADGMPHLAKDMRPLLIAGGYSPNSVVSRLLALKEHGVVKHIGGGRWKLVTQMPAQESA